MISIGVIPSRLNATRFPSKPLAMIAGKPMIQRVWEQAKKSKKLNEVIVATDSEAIAEVIEKVGGKVVLTDPNLPSGTDRVAAVMKNVNADVFINIQGDEPAIDPDTIDSVVQCLADHPNVSIATPAVPFYSKEYLEKSTAVKVVTNNEGNALYFSRAPIPYPRNQPENNLPWGLLHIGLYGYRRHALEWFCKQSLSTLELREGLEQLRFLEYGWIIKVVLTNTISIGVDTPGDVETVVELLKSRNWI
ncbi:MAG: 3-deoxy-manno-octulosonate cytidylyltransferase [bacterium]|nr:3-deoxy-manno-octulosonate cytidylyltransferase [bacterium]